MSRYRSRIVTMVVVIYVGAGGVGSLLAQSKPDHEPAPMLPFEPWARVFSQQDRSRPDFESPVRYARPTGRGSRDTRPPCLMPVIEVSADIDPRMVVPLPDTPVKPTMPIIEASCAPVRR